MTNRERFHRWMHFESTDRMPMYEWAPWWNLTFDSWKEQGLVIQKLPGLNEGESLQHQLGLDLSLQMGISNRTDATPTAEYGAPIVTSMEQYEREIRPTLYPDQAVDIGRLKILAEYQKRGDAIVWITIEGAFWAPRGLLGIENHLYAFYDEPELLRRIIADHAAHYQRALEQVYDVLTPDFMTFAEDMSYNNGMMISEAQFDAFLLPYYQQLIPGLKRHGVPVIVDSDGDITRGIPWFLRAGFDGALPLERQAGVDIEVLRARHPDFLFIGHYDKMCMPKGETAMRQEFERLLPTMRKRGFCASVDHQTPPSVTLEQYKTYIRLFREYAHKAAQ